jgi:superfamily II DNA/RNA helicase
MQLAMCLSTLSTLKVDNSLALLLSLLLFVCLPPTRELAMQLADQFRAFGSGMSLRVSHQAIG